MKHGELEIHADKKMEENFRVFQGSSVAAGGEGGGARGHRQEVFAVLEASAPRGVRCFLLHVFETYN